MEIAGSNPACPTRTVEPLNELVVLLIGKRLIPLNSRVALDDRVRAGDHRTVLIRCPQITARVAREPLRSLAVLTAPR